MLAPAYPHRRRLRFVSAALDLLSENLELSLTIRGRRWLSWAEFSHLADFLLTCLNLSPRFPLASPTLDLPRVSCKRFSIHPPSLNLEGRKDRNREIEKNPPFWASFILSSFPRFRPVYCPFMGLDGEILETQRRDREKREEISFPIFSAGAREKNKTPTFWFARIGKGCGREETRRSRTSKERVVGRKQGTGKDKKRMAGRCF